MARPTEQEMFPEAARHLSEPVIWWLKSRDDTVDDPKEVQAVIDDLAEMLSRSLDTDGYELAKALEDKGWEPDSELVDVLDRAHHIVRMLHQDAVKQWVKRENITLQLAVGDKVVVKQHWKPPVNGTVVKLFPEEARYVVTPDGSDHRYIYDSEVVTKV